MSWLCELDYTHFETLSQKKKKKKKPGASDPHIILATQEAEIRRIMV
jgi:hypothetical protein